MNWSRHSCDQFIREFFARIYLALKAGMNASHARYTHTRKASRIGLKFSLITMTFLGLLSNVFASTPSPSKPSNGERALVKDMEINSHITDSSISNLIEDASQSLAHLHELPRERIPGASQEARPVTVFTLPELRQLYTKLSQQKQIIFEDSKANDHEGGCFARAEEIVRVMELNGMTADKLFILPTTNKDNISIHTRVRSTGEVIDWGYHVVPIVLVKDRGQFKKYVIDPVLSSQPISFESLFKDFLWSDGDNGSFNIIIVDRTAYDINSIRLNVLQKMDANQRWEDSKKLLETQRQLHEPH